MNSSYVLKRSQSHEPLSVSSGVVQGPGDEGWFDRWGRSFWQDGVELLQGMEVNRTNAFAVAWQHSRHLSAESAGGCTQSQEALGKKEIIESAAVIPGQRRCPRIALSRKSPRNTVAMLKPIAHQRSNTKRPKAHAAWTMSLGLALCRRPEIESFAIDSCMAVITSSCAGTVSGQLSRTFDIRLGR